MQHNCQWLHEDSEHYRCSSRCAEECLLQSACAAALKSLEAYSFAVDHMKADRSSLPAIGASPTEKTCWSQSAAGLPVCVFWRSICLLQWNILLRRALSL